MAISSSPDARGAATADRFRLLRELGSRAVPSWAALEMLADGKTAVVVVERVARGGSFGDQNIADWVRDARRLATLEHPNVGRIRDVVIRGEEVLVVTDFIDGVRWSELVGAAQPPSLEIALRVFVDVLSGLGAVHNLRDAKRQPLKLVHGELTPDRVIVGLDGVARVVNACRVKGAAARTTFSASAYLAPAVLLADDSADARADVYSVAAMLWEAMSGRVLFPNMQPSAIVTQLLSGRVPRATVPQGSPWAAPLVDATTRTLSADPEKRFASAAAFAAELRRVGGPKLAPPLRIAALVRATFAGAIRTRREELERGVVRPRAVSGVDSQQAEDIDVDVESAVRPSNAPTPVPPAPSAPTKPPPGLIIGPPPLPPVPVPGPPPPRPRLATLSGVAPPLVHAGKGAGAPVVVPASSRPPPPPEAPARAHVRREDIEKPTPFVAIEPAMLAAPPLPKELAFSTGAVPALQGPSSPASPVSPTPPAPPLIGGVETPDATPARSTSRRGLWIALVAVPVLLLAWMILSRLNGSTGEPVHAASTPRASAIATSSAGAAPVAGSTTDTSGPQPERAEPSAASTQGVIPDATATAAAAPARATPVAAPPPSRGARPKYDPEGI